MPENLVKKQNLVQKNIFDLQITGMVPDFFKQIAEYFQYPYSLKYWLGV